MLISDLSFALLTSLNSSHQGLILYPSVTECFAILRDRIILEVEGEAFAKKYLGMTDEIKTQMLHPYRISGDVGKA